MAPSFQDYAKLLVVPVLIIRDLLVTLYQRARGNSANHAPVYMDLTYSLMRSIFHVPLPIMRNLLPGADAVLNSPRFSPHKDAIFQKVLRADFTVYWLCKGQPADPKPISECDIVIFQIHGGAYITGHPIQNLPTGLRIAEIAAEAGTSVAIVALNYSLSPEVQWPVALNQAVAAYKYLLSEVGVPAEKIALVGESAGGHLVISLLSRIADLKLSKPGKGAFLVSPWIDLYCSSDAAYERNKYKDMLVRKVLVDAADSHEPLNDKEKKEFQHFANFNAALPDGAKRRWKEIMPEKTWIWAGSSELFFDDILAFRAELEASGVRTELEVEEEGIHVAIFFRDALKLQKYLKNTGEIPQGFMPGAERIAALLLESK